MNDNVRTGLLACFHHEGNRAVAACDECGVGLCAGCIRPYRRGRRVPAKCGECGQEWIERAREGQHDVLTGAGLRAILGAVAWPTLLVLLGVHDVGLYLIGTPLVAYVAACLPWGWPCWGPDEERPELPAAVVLTIFYGAVRGIGRLASLALVLHELREFEDELRIAHWFPSGS